MVNSPATVVPDQIDLIDLQSIEDLLQHLGVGSHRDVLIKRDLGITVSEQVDRDATPHVRECIELASPHVLV